MRTGTKSLKEEPQSATVSSPSQSRSNAGLGSLRSFFVSRPTATIRARSTPDTSVLNVKPAVRFYRCLNRSSQPAKQTELLAWSPLARPAATNSRGC